MTMMLLEWVFTSVFLILTVLALRAVSGRRVSARLRYALWAAVLVRLLVPVQLFTSPVAGTWVLTETRTEQNSYHMTGEGLKQDGPEDIPVLDGQDGPSASLSNFPLAPDAPALPDAPEPPSAPDLTKAPAWLGWVWLSGAAVMALALLCSNLRFAWRLRRRRVPVEGTGCPLPVYAAVGLPSPCLFGLVRPKVYVTPEAAADPVMLRHVIAHEYTHFRQGDHIWSFLRCAALAVHWWNPLVWLAVKLSRRDGELACDEGALKRLGDGERLAYGNTLLALVTAKPGPGELLCFATTMAGDKKSLKERVSRIARAPKRWLWAAVAVVLATALACACAFGQAAEELDEPKDKMDADLSFSLETDSDGSYVRIDGTVGDFELTRGAFWRPAWRGMMTKKYPYGHLSMVYPPFTDGIEGQVIAGWLDEGHTKIVLATDMMAVASSYPHSGWWECSVDLERGEVTAMEPLGMAEDGEIRMYPETISDEEAIRAARIAAKLLTAAEDFYTQNSVPTPGVTEAPAPDGGQRDEMAKYQSVLLGKTDFTLRELSYEETWREREANIAEMPKLFGERDPRVKLTSFAVVDMDGDGRDEVVVWICGKYGAESSGYLLFHQMDGKVCGAAFDHTMDGQNWFPQLKTDGTFSRSASGGAEWMWTYIERLQFIGTEYHIDQLATATIADGGAYELYLVNHQEASQEEFDAALAAQTAKPNVVWHEFTEENINSLLG